METIKSDMETIKKEPLRKNTLTEMKNNLQGINSRVDEAKDQISNLEHKNQKIPSENKKMKVV